VIKIGLDKLITGESSSYDNQDMIKSKVITYVLSISKESKNDFISI
jgi:hypothetical protein